MWQSSPHFGGLCEVKIKSVKRGLVKTFGELLLNIDIPPQIEACLNILVSLGNDVKDTFLSIFLSELPDEILDYVRKLRRWQLAQKLSTEF